MDILDKLLGNRPLDEEDNYILLILSSVAMVNILKTAGVPNLPETRAALKIVAKLMEKANNISEEDIRIEVKFYLSEMMMEKKSE